MAGRPSKCRICGHRFSSGEDICPECFTAREDDISCDSIERDEHSHGNTYSTVGSSDVFEEFKTESFVDEQRQDEAMDPIPSATYGGRFGAAPQTYASSTYNAPKQNSYDPSAAGQQTFGGQKSPIQSRQDKLNAIRSGTYNYNRQNTQQPQQNFYNGQQMNRSPQQPFVYGYTRKPSSAAKPFVIVIVIIMLCAFFIPVFVMVRSVSKYTNNAKTDSRKSVDVTVSMPDISLDLPDMDIPSVDKVTWSNQDCEISTHDLRIGKEFDYNEAMNWFPVGDMPFWEEGSTEKAQSSTYRLLEVNLAIKYTGGEDLGYMYYNEDVYLQSMDALGQSLSFSMASSKLSETGGGKIYFVVPADAMTYKLSVPFYSQDDVCVDRADFDLMSFNFIELDDRYDSEDRLINSDSTDDSSK